MVSISACHLRTARRRPGFDSPSERYDSFFFLFLQGPGVVVMVLVVQGFCWVDTVHQVGTTAKTSALSQQQPCITCTPYCCRINFIEGWLGGGGRGAHCSAHMAPARHEVRTSPEHDSIDSNVSTIIHYSKLGPRPARLVSLNAGMIDGSVLHLNPHFFAKPCCRRQN